MVFKMKGWSPFRQEEKKVIARRMVEAKRRNPTYKEAWDNMSDKKRAKHGSYEAFVKAAEEYKSKNK